MSASQSKQSKTIPRFRRTRAWSCLPGGLNLVATMTPTALLGYPGDSNSDRSLHHDARAARIALIAVLFFTLWTLFLLAKAEYNQHLCERNSTQGCDPERQFWKLQFLLYTAIAALSIGAIAELSVMEQSDHGLGGGPEIEIMRAIALTILVLGMLGIMYPSFLLFLGGCDLDSEARDEARVRQENRQASLVQ